MNRYQGLIAETVSHSGFDGDDIESYFARPIGPGPYPTVVVIHQMPGWRDSTKAFTRRLAVAGYAAVCPNLYSREAPGASADDAAATARALGGISDEQAIGDVRGAARYLRALPYSNGKVGVIGFCSGGRYAFLAACTLDVDAVVDAYGGKVSAGMEEATDKRPVAPIQLADGIDCPLLGLFGADDKNPSPAEVAQTRSALEGAGKQFEFISYPGAGHSFMDPSHVSYRVGPANDAWDRICAFYRQHLSM